MSGPLRTPLALGSAVLVAAAAMSAQACGGDGGGGSSSIDGPDAALLDASVPDAAANADAPSLLDPASDGAADGRSDAEASTTGDCPLAPPFATRPGETCRVARAPRMAYPAASFTRWMELAAPAIARTPIGDLVLPGTHDSATYALVPTASRPLSDPFAPDATEILVQLGSLVRISDGWAQAQAKTLAEQLADGIRYVDLRVCAERSGTFRLCHGLYGPTLDTVLDDIAAFAAAQPKEIVVVEVAGFTDWTATGANGATSYGNMSSANIARVHARVREKLGAYAVDPARATARTPVGELWRTQPGRSLVVVFRREPAAPFFGDGHITGTWRDTWVRDEKRASLESALARDAERCPACSFLSFSGAATPDATLIQAGAIPAGPYPSTLRELAEATNPELLGWIANEWGPRGDRLGIVAVDFYETTCLVKLAVSLNGASTDLSGCALGAASPWRSFWPAPLAQVCVTDRQCASGYCNAVCVECKTNAHCPAGKTCALGRCF